MKKATMKKAKTLSAYLLLDRTGSMEGVRDKTIDGFNEYVNGLRVAAKTDKIKTTLTLVQFDSQSTDVLYESKDIDDVPKLTRETFQPRASTNLYDAIGAIIARMFAADPSAAALAILTDGQENSSREYTKETVKKKIDECAAKGWLVTYVGANQDAWLVGGAIGINAANSMTFDQKNTGATMMAMAASSTRYANAGGGAQGIAESAYLSSERKAAGDPRWNVKPK